MYVDVILPLPIDNVFTYSLPEQLRDEWQVGKRVLVPFGERKILSGIAYRANTTIPQQHSDDKTVAARINLKEVICFLDDEPIVTATQLNLWEWVADYYCCTLGEVAKAALPSAMKLESETRVQLSEDFVNDENTYERLSSLTPSERKLMEVLADNRQHSLSEIGKSIGVSTAGRAVRMLIEKGIVSIDEHVSDKYTPKLEAYICLSIPIDKANNALSALSRAKQQHDTLIRYLDLTNCQAIPMKKSLFNAAAVKALVDKGIFSIIEQRIERNTNTFSSSVLSAPHTLTIDQEKTLSDIEQAFSEKKITLLHGVTGSGKTDIYIHLIKKELALGKQVLYLVPEIALTTQLTERLARVFGDRMLVYHSRFQDNERVDIYNRILHAKDAQLIVGVRSSVFLPFRNLSLVIVDEEHESSYKQQDPAPRYNARNVAMILAGMCKANVLLGSATPSVESYFFAKAGMYQLVVLDKRFNGASLPDIHFVELSETYHRRQMQGHLADEVVEHIRQTLDQHKQVIIFINRRGYAPYIQCKSCGYVPKCQNCDVSLTYHRNRYLTCHYCGYTMPLPTTCPKCGKNALADHGTGTEKIEDEIARIFPDARIARMDLDSTRRKNSYQTIIDDFANHHTDILIGTQMVSKGLHFDDVRDVVVVNADSLLNMPDFRSAERSYQMLEQVSGRAGRTRDKGEVFIQSFNTSNLTLNHVSKHDYLSFYEEQIAEREIFHYPPYYRLVYLYVEHKDISMVTEIAEGLRKQLYGKFGNGCSKVIIPLVGRVKLLYRRLIILKIPRRAFSNLTRAVIRDAIKQTKNTNNYSSAHIYADVDPM